MARIRVTAERTYDVFVGTQWRSDLSTLAQGRARVVFITSKANRDLIGELPELSGEVLRIEVEDGEQAKRPDTLLDIIGKLGAAGITRSDLLVAIGGGAVTDLGGFAAATWLRGIDWVAIPTTLAGAVDAAIGGKTGINTEHGKNLMGAFHSPVAVLVDLSWFTTLSDRDFAAGMAEVIKCGFIRDRQILELVEGKSLSEIRAQRVVIEYCVVKAIQVKASVVSSDFRESGEREILNYGHTLGHALEQASQYALRHGECVSIGMVFAAELARAMGLIDEALVQRHRSILGQLGLPITISGYTFEAISPYLALDKKARGKTLRFVLLEGVGHVIRTEPSVDLRSIYERVSS